MSARTLMRHRCTIQRNTAAPDSWNAPGKPGWSPHLVDQPCHAWVSSGKLITPAGEEVSVLDIRMLLPAGVDVVPADRVLDVQDRLGRTVFAGPLLIDTISPRRDHLAVALTETPS